jgi:hypothetical protein
MRFPSRAGVAAQDCIRAGPREARISDAAQMVTVRARASPMIRTTLTRYHASS